jgi:hypothetical protein
MFKYNDCCKIENRGFVYLAELPPQDIPQVGDLALVDQILQRVRAIEDVRLSAPKPNLVSVGIFFESLGEA